MSAPQPNAERTFHAFANFALEYYVNGRAACASGCLFTTGNLLHHAVELILKAELSRTVAIKDLRDRKKFHHSLDRCWKAFKDLHLSDDLSEFDPLIAELDKFEDIRYPDELLKDGAAISFGFGKYQPTNFHAINSVPQYTMGVGYVDAFFARVMRMCHMNPKAYLTFLSARGRANLETDNAYAREWLQ